jgi:hypothetical protein
MMVGRMSVLAGLMAAVVAASAAAQAKVYKTPEEVFDASKAAAKKGDLKGFFALVEPDSVKQLSAGLAIAGVNLRNLAATGKVKKEVYQPILDVMDKHGLTADATKKVKPDPMEKDPEKVLKAAKPLLELIKDKPAFAADVLKAFQKASGKDDADFKVLANAKLKDLKINGDKATGTVVNTIDGEEKKDPITFVKVGKGWMMKLDFTGGKAKGKAKGKDD